eukprot:3419530-Pyramimonas_sp.AAC.1
MIPGIDPTLKNPTRARSSSNGTVHPGLDQGPMKSDTGSIKLTWNPTSARASFFFVSARALVGFH